MVVFRAYSDLTAELPFILMHPKPEEEDPNPMFLERSPSKHDRSKQQDGSQEHNDETTQNLIQLDG